MQSARAAEPVITTGGGRGCRANRRRPWLELAQDAWVHNADTIPAPVDIYFAPAGRAPDGSRAERHVLAPGQTLGMHDVVGGTESHSRQDSSCISLTY